MLTASTTAHSHVGTMQEVMNAAVKKASLQISTKIASTKTSVWMGITIVRCLPTVMILKAVFRTEFNFLIYIYKHGVKEVTDASVVSATEKSAVNVKISTSAEQIHMIATKMPRYSNSFVFE